MIEMDGEIRNTSSAPFKLISLLSYYENLRQQFDIELFEGLHRCCALETKKRSAL